MKKYLGVYNSYGEIENAINNGELYKPYVAAYNVGTSAESVDFNSMLSVDDYEKMYLTFDIISAGTITVRGGGSIDASNTLDLDYSFDGGNTWVNSTAAAKNYSLDIPVSKGDKLCFRGDGWKNQEYSHYSTVFGVLNGAMFNAYGNPRSLYRKNNNDDFATNFKNPYNNAIYQWYANMFYGNKGIVSAKNIILPYGDNFQSAGTYMCFLSMFKECSNLIDGPAINLKHLGNQSCNSMFYNCSSLTYVKLLAETALHDMSWGSLQGFGASTWAQTGTFIMKQGVTDTYITNMVSYLPSGWTIVEV